MKKLEEKPWGEYSHDEQQTLLMHWFYYYGKDVIFLSELEKFKTLARNNTQEVLALATIDFFTEKKGPSFLLHAIRENMLDEVWILLKLAVGILKTSSEKSMEFKSIQEQLVQMLVETYNNPEPDIPMTDMQIKEQIKKIHSKEIENSLNPQFILDLAQECMKGDEPFRSVIGFISCYNFNEQALEEKRQSIAEILVALGINIKTPIVLEDLMKNKEGYYWNRLSSSEELVALDSLLALAVACGFIINDEDTQKVNYANLGGYLYLINPMFLRSLNAKNFQTALMHINLYVVEKMQFVVNRKLINDSTPGEPNILRINL